MERKFFGTDGVRDLANSGNMTPEFALKLGRAFIKFNHGKKIIIGSDTRLTGKMLEGALSSGISSEGADVYSAGIIPTPGVSFAIKYLHADGGAVISASHNPAEYNGIKFLGSDGCKLSDEEELEIENLLFHDESNNTSGNVGNIYDRHELVHAYARHIASFLNDDAVIDNTVFDCANGASAKSVPILVENTKFSRLNTKIISRDFNGLNINKNCGVMNMKNLTDYVVENKMSVGFAFDGDADRVLICDKHGRIIDGDIILWVIGRWLSKRKTKGSDKVVITVMSNMALETHFENEGIKTLRCPVGDRYVLETMRESGAALGGEQSGHIIATEFTGTGDGLCTAMLFLNAIHDLNEDISTLTDRFGRYPQRLTNLTLKKSRELVNMQAINEIVEEYNVKVSKGRIFIRTSGTEPLLRILVEAPEKSLVEELSEILASKLEKFC
ncbi:MAG: phosphoglucosamine mutase [Synergistaceae bacterium]|nr:phosphoglucosamine mutase [Synergistaceae bacterium]MBQ7068585.1 phosphoglucosamine mutase [Synergistaceae bacterium]MBR0074802.1 phosphoglucosamine mutase [Synergistaceae bacterium]MBR0232486.1 phosphoglucosamine mutase [Synergistaceae bacterium]MBR0253795.1 phosphoglucosamine mutase [Synergistaceae bacterium]